MNTLVFAAALTAATNLTTTAELPVVIVEASRLERTASEIPGPTQVITRDEIAASGARDAVDLLEKKVPSLGIHHLGGNNPAAAQITPQGYGENGFGRLLVLVDGERLNNPDLNAPNFAQIPFGAIRQIEVLTGPQSVLHGNGASGGVINIITDPTDYTPHGSLEVHGGSWGSVGARIGLSGGDADTKTLYWGNGGWDHSDGYRHHSGFDLYTLSGGVRQNWDNGSFFRTSAFYNDSDYEVPGELSRADWHRHPTLSYDKDHNKTGVGYYRRSTYGLRSTLSGVIDEENTLRLNLAFSHRQMRSTLRSGWDYPEYGYAYIAESSYVYDMSNFEVNPEWINATEVFGLENEFLLGALYRYETLSAHKRGGTWYTPEIYNLWYGGGPSRAKYELNRQTMGFYAHDTLHLTDFLALEGGARYERLWSGNTSSLKPRRQDDICAGDIALLLTPIEDLRFYTRLTRFFNTPFLDETVGGYDANGAYVTKDLLRPEYGWRVDLGGDYRLDEFSLDANLFLSKTKHEVFYNPNAPFFNNLNSPWDIRRDGLNVQAGWEREKVAGVSLAYALTRAEFDGGEYDGKRVPLTAEQALTLSGRVWLWNDCFVFGGYRFRSNQYSYSDFRNDGYRNGSSARIPAYGLFHLGVNYAPSYALLKGWVASLTIDNLFDKNYCDYAGYGQYYYPGAGRSFLFTLSYAF